MLVFGLITQKFFALSTKQTNESSQNSAKKLFFLLWIVLVYINPSSSGTGVIKNTQKQPGKTSRSLYNNRPCNIKRYTWTIHETKKPE